MKLRIYDVRLAFAKTVFEAKAVTAGSDPRYAAAFILVPNHPALVEINNTIVTVANEKWGAKGPETLALLRKKLHICLHEGDEKPGYEGFPGNWFISASNAVRPRIVDRNNNPLVKTDGRPYSGCYVNAVIDIWAQDNTYGKRINASLMGVQFLRDGDAIGGCTPASEDDFEDLTVGANVEDFA
ncbi:hypothetical protein BK025_08865 [Sodalis sp. TME1]|nr:hypothetical protein BK025_08865 [Sodalis sp. TME1]